MLKVLIVDNNSDRAIPLKKSLTDSGYNVIAHVKDTVNLDDACCELKPDIVIIDTESPSRDTLEHLCVMSMNQARPVVMFTHDDDKEKMKLATKAGVCAYVVGDIPSARLRPVIDAAIVRFDEFNYLRGALSEANAKLSERKLIEKAKGILMKQRSLSEDEAYTALRKLAMQKNMRLGALSEQIIEAAQLLL